MTTTAKRRLIWERDGGVCGICKEPVGFEDMEIDHITPRSFGGGHDLSNLQPAHEPCNKRKRHGHAGHLTLREAATRLGMPYWRFYELTRLDIIQVERAPSRPHVVLEAEMQRLEAIGAHQLLEDASAVRYALRDVLRRLERRRVAGGEE